MSRFGRPCIVFQPEAGAGLLRGVSLLAQAIAPTLGPLPRYVAAEGLAGVTPELLDKAGTIARRVIELRELNANTGAMLLRGMLWQLQEKVGDGGATATVLCQAVLQQARPYLAAGGNAMRLRYYLEQELRHLSEELDHMTRPVSSPSELVALANTVCFDRELACRLGEIFDTVGRYGQVDIRSGYGRACTHDYIEGAYWQSGLLTRTVADGREDGRVQMDNVAIAISDLVVEEPADLVPILAIAPQVGAKYLLLLVATLSERVLAALLAAQTPGAYRIIPVRTPGATPEEQLANMQDLAVMTGGSMTLRITRDSLQRITPPDLGRARRAWADRFAFGIIGGQGEVRRLRSHLANLKAGYQKVEDLPVKEHMQQRIARFMGGSAVLYIGGTTELEMKRKREYARQAEKALRLALHGGYLPGGGTAYLILQAHLSGRRGTSGDVEEQAARHILANALEVPFRTITRNAGFSEHGALAAVRRAGAGHVFDVRSGHVVECVEAGILDVAAVQREALIHAVKTAALLLTTDALVHQKEPELTLRPA